MNKLKVTCVSRKVEKGENERGTRREVGARKTTPAFAKGVITDVRILSRCTLIYVRKCASKCQSGDLPPTIAD